MLDRMHATQLLVDRLTDELVIGGIANPSFELFRSGDRERNFYTWGAMGLASSLAFGVAMCSPKSKVVVLDGDGSLLMNLGSLATIGRYKPANLVHLVWDNSKYEATGGQETASSVTDLVAVAKACGIEKALWANTEAEFITAVETALHEPGPWMLGVKIGVIKNTPERRQAVERLRSRFNLKDPFMAAARQGRK